MGSYITNFTRQILYMLTSRFQRSYQYSVKYDKIGHHTATILSFIFDLLNRSSVSSLESLQLEKGIKLQSGPSRSVKDPCQKLECSFQFAFECCLKFTFELSSVLNHHPRKINQPIKSESDILMMNFNCFLLSGSGDEERRRAARKNGEHRRYKSNGENAAESKYEI